jgi:hypothetical protein
LARHPSLTPMPPPGLGTPAFGHACMRASSRWRRSQSSTAPVCHILRTEEVSTMIDEQAPGKGGFYHIRLQDHFDEKWAGWFEGFVTASRAGGETLLTGPVVDQAALHGLLAQIRDLGLPLQFVVQTDCPCRKTSCPRRGHCQECAAHHGAKGKLPYCLRERTRWDRQCAALAGAKRPARPAGPCPEPLTGPDRSATTRERRPALHAASPGASKRRKR